MDNHLTSVDGNGSDEKPTLSPEKIEKLRTRFLIRGKGTTQVDHALRVKMLVDLMMSMGIKQADWDAVFKTTRYSFHTFEKLDSVPVELARALNPRSLDHIDFCNVKNVDLQVVQVLASNKGYIDLSGVESITYDIAKAFSGGRCRFNLTGLNKISSVAKECLYKHYNAKLILPCPTTLDCSMAKFIVRTQCKSLIFDNTARVEPKAAEILAENDAIMEFPKMASIDMETAASYSKHRNYLFLDGVESLSMDAAKALAWHPFPVFLPKLDAASDSVLDAFAGHPSMFFFSSNLKSRLLAIDAKMDTKKLADLRSILKKRGRSVLQFVCDELVGDGASRGDWYSVFQMRRLRGLAVHNCRTFNFPEFKKIHPYLAECLTFSGIRKFTLNGIQELDPLSAEWLVKPIGLSVRWTKSINRDGKLSLSSLRNVDETLEQVLSKFKGELNCPGVNGQTE